MSDIDDRIHDDATLLVVTDTSGRVRAILRRPAPDAPTSILTVPSESAGKGAQEGS